jgi:hypothetical protein
MILEFTHLDIYYQDVLVECPFVTKLVFLTVVTGGDPPADHPVVTALGDKVPELLLGADRNYRNDQKRYNKQRHAFHTHRFLLSLAVLLASQSQYPAQARRSGIIADSSVDYK